MSLSLQQRMGCCTRTCAKASRVSNAVAAPVSAIGCAPVVLHERASGAVGTSSASPNPSATRLGRRLAPVRQLQRRNLLSCASTPLSNAVALSPIPEGLKLEVKPEDGTEELEYDEPNKVVRIPLSALGEGQRRTKLVLFTCNKCGGRTARLVNPVAWEKGVVFGQCGQCKVWHVLASNNKSMFEEVRYNEDPEYASVSGVGSDGSSSIDDSSSSSSSSDNSSTTTITSNSSADSKPSSI